MANISNIGYDIQRTKKVNKLPQKDFNNIWSTKKIEYYLHCKEHGIKIDLPSPFYDKNPKLRKINISFHYTDEEKEEIKKCKNDVVYFAEKYCHCMTDEGIKNVKLRPYQKKILKELQNDRLHCWVAARQSGKTITSAFFMMWYLCFNFDKNIFTVANKAETMTEVIDKVETIYEYLPYFLKPGIKVNNVKKIELENGCRIIGQATTPKPGLGFTIHLLYCDEFAHIQPNILESFWANIFPTLSSSNISRVIITSTPNGLNKFYKIYINAKRKLNQFNAIRLDWWEVPGRDEEWKRKQIADLGSEASFNEQYGNQFLSTDKILFDVKSLKLWKFINQEYVHKEIEIFDDLDINYKSLKWNPLFDIDNISDNDQFVLSIDPADGIGKDYSVCNIFKIIPLSLPKIRTTRRYESELDFFRLRQIGIFRSNEHSLNQFSILLKTLIYNFFNVENLSVILEMNDNRALIILSTLEKHIDYDENIFLRTKHSINAKRPNIGIKLNRSNKSLYTNQLRSLVLSGKLVIDEKYTIEECSAFGIDEKGNYSSQIGFDDVVMTLVNLVPFFNSDDFSYMVEELFDNINQSKKDAIFNIMENIAAEETGDEIDYSILNTIKV